MGRCDARKHKHGWWKGSPAHTVAAMQRGGQKGLPQHSLCNCASKSLSTQDGRKFGLRGPTTRMSAAKRPPWNPNTVLNYWHGQMLPWSSEIHRKKRRSYLNGLFTRVILEEKYSLGTEGSELQQDLGSLRHTLEQGQQCLLGPASVTLCQPIHPTQRAATCFCYTLNKLCIWRNKQWHRDALCWLFSVQEILFSKF